VEEKNREKKIPINEYREGEVFCAVCFKALKVPDDIERGFHQHCKGKDRLTDNEMASIFCSDEPITGRKQKDNPKERN